MIARQAKQRRVAVGFNRRQKPPIHLSSARMHQIPSRDNGVGASLTQGLSENRTERFMRIRVQKLLARRHKMTVGDV